VFGLFGLFVVSFVGKLCVGWRYYANLHCWTSIKNKTRLKFKYRRTSKTLATKYSIFFLLFGVFG